VFQRAGQILLIVAILAATGSHWMVLQSVAWTGMLAKNLRTNPIREAVERTFNGKNPCELCLEIAKGRQAENESEFRIDWKKLEFSYAPTQFVFSPPSFHPSWPAASWMASPAEAPPVPPPRSVSA
jgi:hypothetical protein